MICSYSFLVSFYKLLNIVIIYIYKQFLYFYYYKILTYMIITFYIFNFKSSKFYKSWDFVYNNKIGICFCEMSKVIDIFVF